MMTDSSTIRRCFVSGVAVAACAMAAVACSPESADTNLPDPQFGPADIEMSDVEVEDGTEGGLDLDNGNVPGSPNDDDLDRYEENLGLNTDE